MAKHHGARNRPKPGTKSKRKGYKRTVMNLRHRRRDIDQIQEDVVKVGLEIEASGAPAAKPFDEDLPGGGQYYCVECARYFVSDEVLGNHKRTKVHKNRVKVVNEEPYTHADAEAAAGMGSLVK